MLFYEEPWLLQEISPSRLIRPVAMGQYPPIFCAPRILLCAENIFEAYKKDKNISPKKCIFAPIETLKPGHGPASNGDCHRYCFGVFLETTMSSRSLGNSTDGVYLSMVELSL